MNKPVFSSILAIGILMFLALQSLTFAQTRPGTGTRLQFTGEELFTGIFFMRGRAAALIPMYASQSNPYQGFDRRQLAYQYRLQQQIIDEMGKIDPGFFASFKTQIDSGDPIQIESALNNAGSMIERGVTKIPDLNTIVQAVDGSDIQASEVTDIKRGLIPDRVEQAARIRLTDSEIAGLQQSGNEVVDNLCGPTVCAVAIAIGGYFVIVVHNTVAITAALAVALAVYKYVGVSKGSPSGKGGTSSIMSTLQSDMLVSQISANLAVK